MAFSGLCFSPLPWSKRPPFSNVLANIVGVWSIVSLARTTNRSTKTVRSHFMYDYFNVGLIWASLRFLVLGCEPRKLSLDIYERIFFGYITQRHVSFWKPRFDAEPSKFLKNRVYFVKLFSWCGKIFVKMVRSFDFCPQNSTFKNIISMQFTKANQ